MGAADSFDSSRSEDPAADGPGLRVSGPAGVAGKGEGRSHPAGPALDGGEGTVDLSDRVGLLLQAGRATEAESSAPDVEGHATDAGQTVAIARPDDPSAVRTVPRSDGQRPPVPRERPLPTIDGYEILGELGRGGMGVVYRARQVLLHRPCVLKMILAGVHANAESIARFLAEAEAVARLQHPNIVQIYHIGEADGLPYFELEYVDGGSLDRRLDGTPWKARRAAELLEALARGVSEAHRLGIVHRDLKPANILLTGNGVPKIADFGLAKSLTNDAGLTRTDSIMGSPGYMSPEQAEGRTKQVGPPADVYALGAILYELLTGGPPFRGPTALEIIDQVKNAEPVPPSRLVPGLQRDIETIALKCLQKEPEKRYASADAAAEDLRRFLDGEAIVARPVPFWVRGIKWARRRPAIATLSLAVLVLLAAMVGLGVLAYVRIAGALHVAEVRRKSAEASQVEALRHSKAAEAQFARARRAVDESFTIVSESKLLNVPGLRALRADLLASSMKFYGEFLEERRDDPSLKLDLLRTRLRVADVLKDLGRTKEASRGFEDAIAGYEQAVRDRPGDLDRKAGLAEALHRTALSLPQEEKIATLRRIVALREEVFRARPADRPSKRDLALACSRLYTNLESTRPAEAIGPLERSVVLRLELAKDFPDDGGAINGVFASFLKLARVVGPSRSLALSRRALEFGRESLRLQPNDPSIANDFMVATNDILVSLSDSGRKEEAVIELRRSVEILGEIARANEDTPAIQRIYLLMSQSLADRLAEQKRPGEAARALLEPRMALDRLSRDSAADIANSAGWRVEIARRLGEVQPDLTPEQKAGRDELLDSAVRDYRAAVSGGWNDVALLKAETPIKDRPDYADLLAEAETAASQPAKPTASGSPSVASGADRPDPAVSRPRLDVKLDRAKAQAALGVARARAGLVDEALASMERARALFDELARERPGDPEVRRARLDALLDFYVAWSALGLDRLRRGKADVAAAALKKADDCYAELSRERPNDPEVEAARRQAQIDLADFRREASHWGETYKALRESESGARRAAEGAPTGGPSARGAVETLGRVGFEYGKLTLWDEAAGALGKAYEIDPVGLRSVEGTGYPGFVHWYRVAVLLLQGGDTEAYERLREKMLGENAAGNLEDPLDQIRTATLRPDPRSDWRQVLDLAGKYPDNNPWTGTVRGFALLRAGKNREALNAFKSDPEWTNGWAARAIVHHRLGQAALAREWLARADEQLRDNLDEALAGAGFTQSGGVSWWDDWLLRMIWTREAHELIDGKAWPDEAWMRRQRARALARVGEAK